MAQQPKTIDWKEEARATGLPVFPILIRKDPETNKFSKRPANCPNGHKDATTDVDTLNWTGANGYGITMGEGLFAVDFDNYKPGSEGAQWALDNKLPNTRVHETVSGGQHWVYKLPEEYRNLPSGNNIVDGLDTRGDGGWIAFGEGYRIIDDREPVELPTGVCEDLHLRWKSKNSGPLGQTSSWTKPAGAETDLQQLLKGNPLLRSRWTGDNTGLTDPSRSGFDLSVARMLQAEGRGYDFIVWALLEEFAYGTGDERQCRRAAKRAELPIPVPKGADEFKNLIVDTPSAIAPSARRAEMVEVFGEDVVEAREKAKTDKRLSEYWVDAGSLKGFDPLQDVASSLKGLVPKQGMGVVYGASGIGKSFVTMDWMLRMAGGQDWHGHRNKAEDGMWIYVSSEGGLVEIKRRLQGWVQKNGNMPTNCGFMARSFAWNRADAADGFIRGCKARWKDIRCVVVDTLNRNMGGGDENDTQGMTGFIDCVEKIWRELGCVVVVVHHEGKDADRGARGSSALKGAAEFEWRVKKDQGNPHGGIYIEKNRHGQDGMAYGFELETVVFGRDSDGDEVSTLVVKPAPGPPKKALNRQLSIAIAHAYENMAGGGEYIDIDALCVEAQDFYKQDTGKHEPPRTFRREIREQLVAKQGWEIAGNGVKASD
jgi:hypothetical protein